MKPSGNNSEGAQDEQKLGTVKSDAEVHSDSNQDEASEDDALDSDTLEYAMAPESAAQTAEISKATTTVVCPEMIGGELASDQFNESSEFVSTTNQCCSLRESPVPCFEAADRFGHIENSMDEFRPLFDVVDDLGRLGLSEIISLPRIVVVGDQSAGKSSVLQSISNVELPHGSGTVTRCPLVLSMQRTRLDAEQKVSVTISWPGQRPRTISRVSEIAKHVEEATRQLAGYDLSNFSDKEIALTIKGPRCPDLTLVDLPGIIRNAEGQLVSQVREMIRKQIAKRESIIAAVVACGDLETSEALAMAKEVDSNKQRTIGILTKPDLQDRGEDMSSVLLGRQHPLKHGYVIVKNRGVQDVRDNMSWETTRDEERKFFEHHAVYGRLLESHKHLKLFGAQNLVDRLKPLLKSAILQYLPDVRGKILEELSRCEDNLRELGEGLPDDDSTKLCMAIGKVEKLKAKLNDALVREVTSLSADGQLSACVQIRRMQDALGKTIRASYEDLILRPGATIADCMFVQFSVRPDNRSSQWRQRMNQSDFLTLIAPCLGLGTSEFPGSVKQISTVAARDTKVISIRGCRDSAYNGDYVHTLDTFNDRPVFKRSADNCFLYCIMVRPVGFGTGVSQWTLGDCIGSSGIAKNELAGSDARFTKEDWTGQDLAILNGSWKDRTSETSAWCDNTSLAIEDIPIAWKATFSLSEEGPGRSALMSRFLRHIHSFEAKAMFANNGFRLDGATLPFEGSLHERIKRLMGVCNGPEPPGFSSTGPFRILMKSLIATFRAPVQAFVRQVHDVLNKCVADNTQLLLADVPSFEKTVRKITGGLLCEMYDEALKRALAEIDKEEGFLFTLNEDFQLAIRAMRDERLRRKLESLRGCDVDLAFRIAQMHSQTFEEEEIQDIEDKIIAYAEIVYKRVADSVPLSVQHFLVHPVAETLFGRLLEQVMKMYGSRELGKSYSENPDIVEKRKSLRHLQERLRTAEQITAEFRYDATLGEASGASDENKSLETTTTRQPLGTSGTIGLSTASGASTMARQSGMSIGIHGVSGTAPLNQEPGFGFGLPNPNVGFGSAPIFGSTAVFGSTSAPASGSRAALGFGSHPAAFGSQSALTFGSGASFGSPFGFSSGAGFGSSGSGFSSGSVATVRR